MRIIALLLLFGATAVAGAQPFDVAVAGIDTGCPPFEPLSRQKLQWVGEAPSTEEDTDISLIAAGPLHIYGVRDGDEIVAFRRGSARTVVATLPGGFVATGLAVDRSGNMFVIAEQGAAYSLLAFTAAGTLRDTYPLGTGFRVTGGSYTIELLQSALDLAADQCTLYLIQNDSVIRRFNACSGTFLPDFATLPRATDLRVLPDGGLLVTTGEDLVRFGSAGNVVRTYTGAWDEAIPLALARGGTVAWLAEDNCESRVFELDLGSGSVLSSPAIEHDLANSLVPSDVWTAALGPAALAANDIPTFSTLALAVMAILSIVVAWRRLM